MGICLALVLTQTESPDRPALRLISAARSYAALTGDAVHLAVAPIQPGLDLQKAAAAFSEYADHVSVLTPPSGALQNLASETASFFETFVKQSGALTVLAAADSAGKDFVPRLATKLKAAFAPDCVRFLFEQGNLLFLHPMWAGRVLGKVRLKTALKLATVRVTEFEPAQKQNPGKMQFLTIDSGKALAKRVSLDLSDSKRPSLADAKIVVSGGRGCKDKAGFESIVYGLADTLGAAVGATRAAVDLGMIGNEAQVGQTGQAVAPDLYFALGISGAIQHLAGLQSARAIVAINRDPDAPIFQVADYGLVADLFEAVPDLEVQLSRLFRMRKK